MNTGEKIKAERIKAGYTQKKLADLSGVAEITIRQYESGKREPRNEQLIKIAQTLNVNFYDLIGYAPDDLKQHVKKIKSDIIMDRRKSALLTLFDELNYKGATKAIEHVEILTRIPEYQKEPASAPESKIIVLPYFRAGVSAGSGIFILGNEAEDEIELPDLPEYEAADFAIDVNGDSMEPDFSHEDIALVQQDAELFPGDIGVFVVNSNAFIKELGKNELISRNKDYKNIPIHEGDNVVCMGKVIGKVKTDEE